MPYAPPTTEQRFVLDHVVRIAELVDDPDLIDAIIEGAGAFAAGEYAPLNRLGDQVGARWQDGKVVMPEGFRAAFGRSSKAAGARSTRRRRSAGRGCPMRWPPWSWRTSAPQTWAFR